MSRNDCARREKSVNDCGIASWMAVLESSRSCARGEPIKINIVFHGNELTRQWTDDSSLSLLQRNAFVQI